MKTIEQKLTLLKETAEAYTVDTRCFVPGKGCFYYKEGHQGCAIGRLVEDKELCKRLDEKGVCESNEVSLNDIFEKLPLSLQEFGQSLLTELQVLHDLEWHWDNNGLSKEGKEKVKYITKKVTTREL